MRRFLITNSEKKSPSRGTSSPPGTALRILTILICLMLFPALAWTKETSPPVYATVILEKVPHIRQKPDFCGEACAAMALQKLGVPADQDYVFDQSELNPVLGRGCYTRELTKSLEKIGFDLGKVWYQIPAQAGSTALQEQFSRIHQDLKGGTATIICMRYDDQPNTTEHFRLIVGYDGKTDEVLYHEPAENDGAYRRMPRQQLLSLWPLKYSNNQWTLIRMRLKLLHKPQARASTTHTNADYCQHIQKLRTKLPSRDFHITIQPPFVVVGDESAETVQQRANRTIKWAVDHLKQDYFDKDPQHILDIWLFKDEDSYTENVKLLFNDRPSTPYGYYSSKHRALVMNIATGGGTLVHEIVHPFMGTNFENCPSWFNEGLASLYEQCGEADGHIRGETNWRLNGLQQAIRGKRLKSFKELCGTSTAEFYEDPEGTHYGQARYLCYYLQEKGLLRQFYRDFRKNAPHDPTGYQTLQKLLQEKDMVAFQKRWEDYVLKLNF